MRLHLHNSELEPEHINLILIVTLLLAVGGAIFYLGTSFSVPSQPTGLAGVVSTW
jgi:hypothetical protein